MDMSVITNNLTYFLIGQYPKGPIGGIVLTLYLAAVSGVLSFIFGVLLALMSVAHNRFIRWVSLIYISVFRGLPLLMVIFWMFFILPAFTGKTVPESLTVIVALVVFTAAYMAEITRAGMSGIPSGQLEAGRATGLNEWQIMHHIILPQALRNMIPSFVNQFVSLIKDTSLAFIVGVAELTHIATQVNNRSLVHPTEIFLFVAVVYFIVCFSVSSVARSLEKR